MRNSDTGAEALVELAAAMSGPAGRSALATASIETGGKERPARRSVRLALAQFAPPARDIDACLARCRDLLRESAGAEADWLLLPELTLGGYQLEHARAIALCLDAAELQTLQRDAEARGIGLQVGFAERDGSRLYNSTLTVTAGGERAVYRKTHLFRREADVFAAGSALAVIDCGDISLAPLICYDIEFPEPARRLAQHGAQMVFVSTANMEPYQEEQVLFARTRALENRIFVAIANRVGEDEGFYFFGGSLVTDPFGRVVAQAGSEEALLLADCDLDLIDQARAGSDYLRDRRADFERQPVIHRSASRRPTAALHHRRPPMEKREEIQPT